MKKLYIIISIGIFIIGSVNAQSYLFLREQEIDLKDGKSTAWVFPVVNDLEEAMEDLQEYCKDRSDVKLKKDKENLYMAEKVSIPIIATKRGDLIGQGFITENYYGMALVFQMGYDISVNSEEWAIEMSNFRNYARGFMSYHYEQHYTRRIEALEKEIKTLEKDTKQSENKISSITKKIGNLNEKLAKETDDVKKEAFNSEITSLESDIQLLSDTLPLLNSKLEELQGDVQELQSESNTYQTTIGSI